MTTTVLGIDISKKDFHVVLLIEDQKTKPNVLYWQFSITQGSIYACGSFDASQSSAQSFLRTIVRA